MKNRLGKKMLKGNNNNVMMKSKSTPNMKQFQLDDDTEVTQKKQDRAARFQKDFKKSSSFNSFNLIPKGESVRYPSPLHPALKSLVFSEFSFAILVIGLYSRIGRSLTGFPAVRENLEKSGNFCKIS